MPGVCSVPTPKASWEVEITTIATTNVVMGMYVNNNPTLQDLWNTTPAWGFPFSSSGLVPTPDAAPLISGGVSQQVIGFGGYGMIADWLYLEAGAYTTLPAGTQRSLGVDPASETQIDNFAPYWRLTLEKTWGPHVLSLGTFGLSARTFPGRDSSDGHDRLTDVGLCNTSTCPPITTSRSWRTGFTKTRTSMRAANSAWRRTPRTTSGALP